MPQRHSRNNNDLAHFTYEERRSLGFGTQKERLGKDSIKPFDSCCLCVKPVIDALSCKEGHLFCKECIYGSLVSQKKDIKRKLALFSSQELTDKEEEEEKVIVEKERLLEEFERQNNSALPLAEERDRHLTRQNSSGGFHGANSVKTTAYEEEALRTMKAYWLPSATPEAVERAVAPSKDTLCPEGGEKLRLKDLFAVNFTDLPRRERREVETGGERFMCPSCSETLTSRSTLAVSTLCGHVYCKKCMEAYVVKDSSCMVCSKPCKKKDVVELEKGGTGFCARGAVQAATFKHLGSGPGAAPSRKATRL